MQAPPGVLKLELSSRSSSPQDFAIRQHFGEVENAIVEIGLKISRNRVFPEERTHPDLLQAPPAGSFNVAVHE